MNGIFFKNAVNINNKLYSFSSNLNGLFEVDIDQKVEKYLSSVPGYDAFAEHMFYDIQKWENKIIGIPYHCNKICLYDITSGLFELIKISEKSDPEFLCSFIWKNKLYIPANKDSCIYIYDLVSMELEIINLKTYWGKNLSCKSVVLSDDNAYHVSSNDNRILKINLNTKHISIIKTDNESIGFNSIIKYKNMLYAVSRFGGHIAVINTENDSVSETIYISDQNNITFFSNSFVDDNILYLLPANYNYFVRMDCLTNEITQIPLNPEFNSKSWSFSFAVKHNGKAYAFSNAVQDLIAIDNSQERLCLQIEKKPEIFNLSNSPGKVNETIMFDLADLIKNLSSLSAAKKEENTDQHIGKKIHYSVKGEI